MICRIRRRETICRCNTQNGYSTLPRWTASRTDSTRRARLGSALIRSQRPTWGPTRCSRGGTDSLACGSFESMRASLRRACRAPPSSVILVSTSLRLFLIHCHLSFDLHHILLPVPLRPHSTPTLQHIKNKSMRPCASLKTSLCTR